MFCAKTVCLPETSTLVKQFACFLLSGDTTCVRAHIFTYSFIQYALRCSEDLKKKQQQHDSKEVVAFILMWRCTTVCACRGSLPCGCCSVQMSQQHTPDVIMTVCWISVRYGVHVSEPPVFERFTCAAPASTCEGRATVNNFPLFFGSRLGAH